MLKYSWKPPDRKKMFKFYRVTATIYPLINMILACYVLESMDEDDANFQLNKVRSSFKCFPRLADFWTEFFLVIMPLILCCLVIMVLILQVVFTIFKVSLSTASTGVSMSQAFMKTIKKALGLTARMFLLGLITLVLFSAYLAVTAHYSDLMVEFSDAADEWRSCQVAANVFFPDCGGLSGQEWVLCRSDLYPSYVGYLPEYIDKACPENPDVAPRVDMMSLYYLACCLIPSTTFLVLGLSKKYRKDWFIVCYGDILSKKISKFSGKYRSTRVSSMNSRKSSVTGSAIGNSSGVSSSEMSVDQASSSGISSNA